jgi:hypothetical protein
MAHGCGVIAMRNSSLIILFLAVGGSKARFEIATLDCVKFHRKRQVANPSQKQPMSAKQGANVECSRQRLWFNSPSLAGTGGFGCRCRR